MRNSIETHSIESDDGTRLYGVAVFSADDTYDAVIYEKRRKRVIAKIIRHLFAS